MASGKNVDDILPAETWLQEEDVADDSSSDYMSSTASLTESIYEYRTIHGRTYNSDKVKSQYWASNDSRQSQVLDISHHASTLALGGKLHLSPLKKEEVKNVLDLGTGTGIWAIDLADQYPKAKIIGTDISPIQPDWVPENVRFEIEDFNQPWTFPTNHFDFIHTRWLIGCPDDWNVLAEQAYDALKPGGWLETHEMSAIIESDDGTVTDETALGQWGKIFIKGGTKLGRSFQVLQHGLQRKAMEAAGFEDIQEFDIKMPIGAWPAKPDLKEMGAYSQLVLELDPEGYVLFLTTALGWSREAVLGYVAAIKKETRSGEYHPYYREKVVYGRKPVKSGY